MNASKLLVDMVFESNEAATLARDLLVWAERNGEKLTEADIRRLIKVRETMQRALSATAELERMARALVVVCEP